jgi:adenylate cyclase
MRRLRRVVGLAVFIAIIGIGLRPTAIGVWLEDDLALQWLFAIRGPVKPPSNVVVVSIDKGSSDQLGLNKESWPPPRHIHANVVRALSRQGVSAIIMDVFFKDPRTVAEDQDLANAIAESGKVALFERVDRLKYGAGEIVQRRSPISLFRDAALATAVFPLPDEEDVRVFWTFFDATSARVATLPSVALQIQALPRLGPMRLLLERAGINLTNLPGRVATVDDTQRLMATLRHELSSDPNAARRTLRSIEQETGDRLTVDDRRELSALVRLYAGADLRYLNFYGPPGSITTIPFHELLVDREKSARDLKGAVVFVGEGAVQLLTNSDQHDTYRTTYSHEGIDLSGAEIAATAFANLVTNRALRRTPFLTEAAILCAFALVSAFLTRSLPWLYGCGAILLIGCAYYAAAQYLFARNALLLPLGMPLLVQIPASVLVAVLTRYRHIRKQVAGEVEPGAPPELVQAVCLSTDIENYMTASAGMEPGELARLMGAYYDEISRLVTERKGLMMGRAGDSVMCVWSGSRSAPGGPQSADTYVQHEPAADQRARDNACQAALKIRDTIERFTADHPTPLRTRIGLHIGNVALGGVGGEYHVVGEVPNTASRIEGLNKLLGTTILASESVVHDQHSLCCRRLGRFVLAGRPGELAIVEILGLEGVDRSTRERCDRFAEALAAFETGDLARAGALFQAMTDAYPSDGPARFYQRLCSGDSAVSATAGTPPVIRVESK